MIHTRNIMTGFEWGKVDKLLDVPLCVRCKWCRLNGYSTSTDGKLYAQGACVRYAPRPDFAQINPQSSMCGEFERRPFCEFAQTVFCPIDEQFWKELYETGCDLDMTHAPEDRCPDCDGQGGESMQSLCKVCHATGLNPLAMQKTYATIDIDASNA